MLFFRRKTLFHVEESLPDPEELKLRFRRRVLILTFLGFLVVLAIPVARDLRSDLATRRGARLFAEKIIETRLLAARSRNPISLELKPDSQSWKRVFHARGGNDCAGGSTGPEELWPSEISWKLQVQREGGETFGGRVLCLHPTLGILLDSVPVENGKLLVTALRADLKDSAYLLISSFGADLQMINHWNY
jgi:hypothetical protein